MKLNLQTWIHAAALALLGLPLCALVWTITAAWAASTDFEDTVTVSSAVLQMWDLDNTGHAFEMYDYGATNPNVAILPDGIIQWGSGSGAADLTLERGGAAWLKLGSLSVFQIVGGGGDWAVGTPADGMLYYDTTADLFRGRANGAWITLGGSSGMTSFSLAGDVGTPQTITDGNTLTIAGGTNGIDTTAGATDTATINFDATEVDAVTWSAGGAASRVWTWNNSGAVDPTLTFGDGVISTNGNFGLPTGGNILVNAAVPRRSIMLRAYEMWPSTTNGATGPTKVELTTNKQNVQQLTFNGLAASYIEFATPMPDNWDGGTVYAVFYWSSGATDSAGVRWGIQGRSYGDTEGIDQAWGTGAEVTDNVTATANQFLISAETGACTLAGTPAGGEFALFRVYRDPANAGDTELGNADLHAVKLEYTIQDYGE